MMRQNTNTWAKFKWPVIWLVLAALLLRGSIEASRDAPAPKDPRWLTDFDLAARTAKAQGKLLLVDFGAVRCPGCQAYKRSVFPTARFKEATRNMVLVDVDVDAEENANLAVNSGVYYIPDIRIISPQGRQLAKVVSYDDDALYAAISRASSVK
jgi:thiol:disulfide interchange protein